MQLDTSRISVIGFDADDTLWANELVFRDAEGEVAKLLSDYEVEHALRKQMYAIETENLAHYGYGIKGFVLSMIELAIKASGGQAGDAIFAEILAIGKRMLEHPVEVLPDIRSTLQALQPHYRLVVITKGDLLDQERKLRRSGLLEYFHHTEVVSNKTPHDYERALKRMDISAAEFLMIGNSLKSDVLPVLSLGAQAIHIPYHVTWEHELATAGEHEYYLEMNSAAELLPLLLSKTSGAEATS